MAALAVVVGIALVALNAGSDEETSPPGSLPTRTTPATTPPPTVATTPPATSEPTTEASVRAPAQTLLRILNGTSRAGLARQMATRARQQGYPEAKLGNTPRAARSTVYFRNDSRAEAEEFARRFPEFTEIAPAPASFATDVMLTVVVGEDYPGSASPSASPSA